MLSFELNISYCCWVFLTVNNFLLLCVLAQRWFVRRLLSGKSVQPTTHCYYPRNSHLLNVVSKPYLYGKIHSSGRTIWVQLCHVSLPCIQRWKKIWCNAANKILQGMQIIVELNDFEWRVISTKAEGLLFLSWKGWTALEPNIKLSEVDDQKLG